MKIIAEFRIPMPFTSDEMEVGLLYTIVQAMYEEAGDGTGTKFLYNEPYNYPDSEHFPSQFRSGQYTYKIHITGDRLPWWIKLFFGGQKGDIHEESWNSHPFFNTIITLPNLFGGKFHGVMKSMLVDLENDNFFNLGEDDLEKRKIVDIDIAGKMFESYEDDPTQFKSEKTGLGPLSDDWMEKTDHITNNYKLMEIDLSIAHEMIPERFKDFVIRMTTKVLWKYYRKMFCTMDEWINLTMDDIRKLEKECAERLPEEMRKEGKMDRTSIS